MNQKNRFNRWSSFTILFSAFIITLFIIELSLRLYAHFIVGLPFFDLRRCITDKELGWKMNPGFVGPGSGIKHLIINQHGFRGKDYSIVEKSNNTLRLMIIGDSNSAGVFSELEDTCLYAYKLEQILNFRLKNTYNIEVVNASCKGYSTHQGRIILNKYFNVFNPDIVIIFLGANDAWPAKKPDKEGYYNSQIKDGMNGLDNVMTFIALKECLKKIIKASIQSKEKGRLEKSKFDLQDNVRVPPAHFYENLIAMADFVKAKNSKLIIITYPFLSKFKFLIPYMDAYRDAAFDCS